MVVPVDLHIHTLASGHGTKDSISDILWSAAQKEMKIIGISDHGPATAGSADLSYFRNLPIAPKKRYGIQVLYGAEANILDSSGRLDLPDDVLSRLDYAIISMHQPIFSSGTLKENTDAYCQAMKHPNVRILGHCDDSRFPVDYPRLVHACVIHKVYPEINNVSLLPDSYRLNCYENTRLLLEECRRQRCSVILSSDSHGKEGIGEMNAALSCVEALDFPKEFIANQIHTIR